MQHRVLPAPRRALHDLAEAEKAMPEWFAGSAHRAVPQAQPAERMLNASAKAKDMAWGAQRTGALKRLCGRC